MTGRSRGLSFGAVVLTATVLLSAYSFPEPTPECVRADAWVKEHGNLLPTALAEFSQYSLAYRKAIYNGLTPQARKQLWREHLATYADGPNSKSISDRQRMFVRGLAAGIDTLFDQPRRVEQLMFQEFSRLEARDIIAILGPSDRRKVEVGGFELAKVGVAPGIGDCTCSTWTMEWCWLLSCVWSGGCGHTQTGCGTFWLYQCDGLCGG